MTSYLRLLVFLIPISVWAGDREKVDHKETKSTVIMEDVVVERTVIRTTKQNPKEEQDNYDNDRDFLKNASKMLPTILLNLVLYR
jgi:hypothetical protein